MEVAKALLAAGASSYKFRLESKGRLGSAGIKVTSMLDQLTHPALGFLQVLDMPFTRYVWSQDQLKYHLLAAGMCDSTGHWGGVFYNGYTASEGCLASFGCLEVLTTDARLAKSLIVFTCSSQHHCCNMQLGAAAQNTNVQCLLFICSVTLSCGRYVPAYVDMCAAGIPSGLMPSTLTNTTVRCMISLCSCYTDTQGLVRPSCWAIGRVTGPYR